VQTKIGLDKFPVPSIESEVPLSDIVTGEALVDQSGLPLVTNAELAISQIANSSRAASVVIGQDIKGVPVIEQFPETSETATTLLGITRSETQISLFSDVSVLGLDTDVWDSYSWNAGGIGYGPWNTRTSRDFGRHYGARLIEETGEQAIQLGAFPVPYSYPFGPLWRDAKRLNSTTSYFNEELYNQFINFINLGNYLHHYYKYYAPSLYLDSRGRPFEDNFLDYNKIRTLAREFSIGDLDLDKVEFIGDLTEADGFTLIDTWTRAWVDIQLGGLFLNPAVPGTFIDESYINALPKQLLPENAIRELPQSYYIGDKPSFSASLTEVGTRPGYSSSYRRYTYLQSRKAYRYQPGRISGFTFGAKASTDVASNQNISEWGIANPTDQYVFQIQGASFSIVRRSTVQLDSEVMIAQGLNPLSQTFQGSGDPYDSTNYYTLKIPRDNFNGDTLLGNDRSNYLLTPSNVTMYKIEFGWYGAIGARFYVYIPVDNGECRWVLVHTLVIENKLGQPCLEDPYFKFKYSLDIRNTAFLKEPQFIYKYGASCYIDGGDDGSTIQVSYSSGQRTISSDPKPILGIWPKLNILNSDGIPKINKKIIFPKSLTVSSSNLVRLDIVKCVACRGYGYGYNHGLQAEQTGRVLNIAFIDLGTIIITTEGEYFTDADIGSKIIANGLWAGYIESLDVEDELNPGRFEQAKIVRIVSPLFTKEVEFYPPVVKPRGAAELLTIPIVSPDNPEGYPYPVRLSQYNAVAASTVALSGSKIEILFMNTRNKESLGHWTEFLLGVTDKKPFKDLDTDTLKWEYSISDIRDTIPLDDILYGEYVPGTTNRDRDGYEVGETNPTHREVFDVDDRTPIVPGITGGLCSRLTIEVLDKEELPSTQMVQNNPNTNADPEVEPVEEGAYYLKLQAGASFPVENILGGEVGIFQDGEYIATGITFTSEAYSYLEEFSTIQYAKISGPIEGVQLDTNITIAFTPLRAYSQYISKTKIIKFNPFPLYLVAMLRDNATINSISVSETIGDTTVTSTPQWVLNSNASKYPLINNPAQDDLPPVNFVSNNRLDAAAVDTQLEQALRPYEVLYSFYVAPNQTLDVDLTNIFGSDRASINPDVLNLEAAFIVGQTVGLNLGDTTATIELSLNTAEQ
jgi:hypothetical protein